jgi:hypothetical protein
MGLRESIEALRPRLAEAAQKVVDSWEQDEDGMDDTFGGGGVCDAVANSLSEILSDIPGVELTDGGQDGDDHAFVIAYDDKDAYAVDIPPGVYETGGGYSWTKIDGAAVRPEDVTVHEVKRSDVVDDFARMAARIVDRPV